ncbi:MAG: asparagine synthetase B [Deltaproteobacteria bacterium]|nr:asparagine synthetase B [Deltaproteobacteria bacterium]
MCGIAAAFRCEGAAKRVEAMLGLLRHRGDQDDPILSLPPRTALGTRRLKILDRKRAIQPMWSFDGRFAVVLNGQIYNFRQLRHELSINGAAFHTDSDTEVVANALALWGPSAIERFRGMFAFVAIDYLDQSLIAARDPFGIKPLYFSRSGEGLLFASEISALLKGSTNAILEEVRPGHILTDGVLQPYTPRVEGQLGCDNSLSLNARYLYRLLHRAVKERLPDRLPCAVFFSGGIDSTLVLHAARRFNRKTRAYLVSNLDGRDRPYALEYADATDSDLVIVGFNSEDVLTLIPEIVRTTESFEPNMIRNGAFSTLLAKRVHMDGIRVALCGEGADELFCGYPEIAHQGSAGKVRELRQVFLSDLYRTQLQRVDRCSMAHSVETRVPFLDLELTAFSDSLPTSHLVSRDQSNVTDKAVLRQIYLEEPTLRALSIGKREKVVLVDGAGMGDNSRSGPFFEYAEQTVSDTEFQRMKSGFPGLQFSSKEEVMYFQILDSHLDLRRVPFLAKRPHVNATSTTMT